MYINTPLMGLFSSPLVVADRQTDRQTHEKQNRGRAYTASLKRTDANQKKREAGGRPHDPFPVPPAPPRAPPPPPAPVPPPRALQKKTTASRMAAKACGDA